MRARKWLMSLVVLASFLGCQQAQDVASPDAAWTTYESENEALRFALPDGLRKNVRSIDPVGVCFENQSGDFSISILHGSDYVADDEFTESMIEVALDGCRKLGETQEVDMGSARGLQQDHRELIGYKHYVGRTITMISGSDRIVFSVNYAERSEDELKPVFERVVSSLEFGMQPSTTTRNVSVRQ